MAEKTPTAARLSDAEFKRLVGLFPTGGTFSEVTRAALMANNCPAVARKWLEDEGLLDSQLESLGRRRGMMGADKERKLQPQRSEWR